MVSSSRPHHRDTYAQYVAVERDGSRKHEFFDGEIYAMARGTEDHAALAVSTLAALLAAVGEVICGPMQQHPPSPDATAVNPLVLLEITSDPSEEYDTNGKLDAYKTIPTVREVILISHRERRVTIHRREAGGSWLMRVAIAGGRISVEALGAELNVDAIYRNSSIAR
jgi:Uma2 family endonuclease